MVCRVCVRVVLAVIIAVSSRTDMLVVVVAAVGARRVCCLGCVCCCIGCTRDGTYAWVRQYVLTSEDDVLLVQTGKDLYNDSTMRC